MKLEPGQAYRRIGWCGQDAWNDPYVRSRTHTYKLDDIVFVVGVFNDHPRATRDSSTMTIVLGEGHVGWLDLWHDRWEKL